MKRHRPRHSAETSSKLLLGCSRETGEHGDSRDDLVHEANMENVSPSIVGTDLLVKSSGHLIGEVVERITLVEQNDFPSMAWVLFARVSAVARVLRLEYIPFEGSREEPRMNVGDIPWRPVYGRIWRLP